MPSKTWDGFMSSDEITTFWSTFSYKSKEMKEKKWIASRSQRVLNGLQKLGAASEWVKSSWSELSLLDFSSCHSSLGAILLLVIFLSPGIQFPKPYLFSMLWSCYGAFVGPSCLPRLLDQPSELVLKVSSYKMLENEMGHKEVICKEVLKHV